MDDSEPEGINRKEHIDHIEIFFVTFVLLSCYPKTKPNMFVVESKDQAAIFSVLSVASISR